jgi:hypothetical protein
MTNRLTQPGSDQGEKTLARELWAEAANGENFPEDATPEECKMAIEIFSENGWPFDGILNMVMQRRSSDDQ